MIITIAKIKNNNKTEDHIKEIKKPGVEIVGGCCGTIPEYIKKIKETI
ncbi:MAG: homocysteine S-methyltransferase family protein [Proteobacteria bacterium]|nr:homocysteine S-methyltransferase family protein [Pseudomonadota bacterium]MBU1697882.1 homocysteine S-methyltransferase family protein [Pseudomonadota bacterium]